MGSNFAHELADQELFPELDREVAIGYHLQSNHYPPVPLSMVEPCIEAIDAYNDGMWDKLIELPEGVLYRGQTNAPAHSIIEAHHLDAWLWVNE